ncbi:MAG: DUF4124 domain-containing protein [Gammaproteobacteria bacterium]
MRWTKISWLLVLLAIPAAALAQGIYRWTDEAGQIQFGDRPATVGAEKVKGASTGDPTTIERLQRQQELLHSYAEQRAEKSEQSAKTQAEKVQRAAKCTKVKNRLVYLQQARYIYEQSDNGERRILSDSERETSAANAQEKVSRLCS